jgi:hypothetical protein
MVKACWNDPPTSPRRPPGLSEDAPQLELPRSLRGFLFLAAWHRMGNQAHSSAPSAQTAMSAGLDQLWMLPPPGVFISMRRSARVNSAGVLPVHPSLFGVGSCSRLEDSAYRQKTDRGASRRPHASGEASSGRPERYTAGVTSRRVRLISCWGGFFVDHCTLAVDPLGRLAGLPHGQGVSRAPDNAASTCRRSTPSDSATIGVGQVGMGSTSPSWPGRDARSIRLYSAARGCEIMSTVHS